MESNCCVFEMCGWNNQKALQDKSAQCFCSSWSCCALSYHLTLDEDKKEGVGRWEESRGGKGWEDCGHLRGCGVAESDDDVLHDRSCMCVLRVHLCYKSYEWQEGGGDLTVGNQ